jgi:uroporphyrinogen decarboxylase
MPLLVSQVHLGQLCYAVEDKVKSFDKAKVLFSISRSSTFLLQNHGHHYFIPKRKKAGVNAVQIFDSWGGMLSPVDYQEFSWKYINKLLRHWQMTLR